MELLTFTFEGKERKARRVNMSDYAAMRETIRRERMDALGMHPAAEALAAVIAARITPIELSDRIMSLEGGAQIVFRCVHGIDETFTKEEADRMVLDEHPFFTRLYVESKLINPTVPPASEKPSSKPG